MIPRPTTSDLSRQDLGKHGKRLAADGWTLLDEALPARWVAELASSFATLLAAHAAAQPTNRGAQRHQMYLAWEPPFCDPLLFANPAVLAVVAQVLGDDAALVYFASDTPLPGSDWQKVHADTRQLFPEAALPVPCYGLVLNVPLVDCSEENGSLEFWPGTHLIPRRPEGAEAESGPAGTPSRRADMPAGSLLLRDLRMWHRGTPNRSHAARPHLALVYVRGWYRFEQQTPAIGRAAWEALDPQHRALLRFARIQG